VRFHESAERGGEAFADLLATSCGLELVDVQFRTPLSLARARARERQGGGCPTEI
jgi:hypothetical protein